MKLPETLLKSVAFLGSTTTDEAGSADHRMEGTGFFVALPARHGLNAHVYFVTALHVIETLKALPEPFWIRVNTKSGSSVAVPVEAWIVPEVAQGEHIDLAVIPIQLLPDWDVVAVDFAMLLTEDMIRVNSVGLGDEVSIVGVFSTLPGSKRNTPMVRTGNVALFPEDKLHITGKGRCEVYLIEARSLGGLSGSPVFVAETRTVDIQGGFAKVTGPLHLLGMATLHWEIDPAKRNNVLIEPLEEGKGINIGIAIVVPARRIADLLMEPELVAGRAEKDDRWPGPTVVIND